MKEEVIPIPVARTLSVPLHGLIKTIGKDSKPRVARYQIRPIGDIVYTLRDPNNKDEFRIGKVQVPPPTLCCSPPEICGNC